MQFYNQINFPNSISCKFRVQLQMISLLNKQLPSSQFYDYSDKISNFQMATPTFCHWSVILTVFSAPKMAALIRANKNENNNRGNELLSRLGLLLYIFFPFFLSLPCAAFSRAKKEKKKILKFAWRITLSKISNVSF